MSEDCYRHAVGLVNRRSLSSVPSALCFSSAIRRKLCVMERSR